MFKMRVMSLSHIAFRETRGDSSQKGLINANA